jgi:hypothetical protein
MKLTVADDKKIGYYGKFHKVKFQIQYFNLQSKLYIFPLGGVDVVLGVQWLQTLGAYSVNHQEHFIQFKWQFDIPQKSLQYEAKHHNELK